MSRQSSPSLSFEVLTPLQPGFAAACGDVAQLFARREAEFGFNPAIERPVIAPAELLGDPATALAAILAGDGPVTILTTWTDRLGPLLQQHGFALQPIDWLAGPANSGVFRRAGSGRETYLELVNEEAPEIAPTHVLTVSDATGLSGGTIATLRDDAAWLAVMVVRQGLPPGTGTRLWEALVRDLAVRGIARLDLGTQTAEAFYARCGLKVTERVVPRLRWRPAAQGQQWSDLVMMTIGL
jgi:hypothetical protein